MRKFIILLSLLVASTSAWAGPFGLSAGMTREQIVSLVGAKNVHQLAADVLGLDTVPQPNPDVNSYMCMVSPSEGLLAIYADIDVETPPTGDGLKARFSELLAILQDKYGKAMSVENGLVPYIKAKDKPELFVNTLASGERRLDAAWSWRYTGNDFDLEFMSLTGGIYPDGKTGRLSLVYYFRGMGDYLEAKKKAKASVY